jgi:hypothetical protein
MMQRYLYEDSPALVQTCAKTYAALTRLNLLAASRQKDENEAGSGVPDR